MAMAANWVESEFEAVFREHFGRMVRITRRVLGSDAEAEEICSDTFLKLYRSGPGVAARGTVTAWLYRVATRASIDRLRQNQRRGVGEEIDPETGPEANDLQDPLIRLMRSERIAAVRSTLARLKPEKAQLLLLRHSGLSYQEIADAMRMKAASVGTMLARAEAEFSTQYHGRQNANKRGTGLQMAKDPSD
jgi:RNA polymerase sigma-70 factor (ECF subfamily)